MTLLKPRGKLVNVKCKCTEVMVQYKHDRYYFAVLSLQYNCNKGKTKGIVHLKNQSCFHILTLMPFQTFFKRYFEKCLHTIKVNGIHCFLFYEHLFYGQKQFTNNPQNIIFCVNFWMNYAFNK